MCVGLMAQSEYDNPDICDLWFEGKALYEQGRYRASIDFLDQVTQRLMSTRGMHIFG